MRGGGMVRSRLACAEGIVRRVGAFVPSIAMKMGEAERRAVTSAALLVLGQWTARLGVNGMIAMRVLPGLLAEVDQHATHVRRAIADPQGRLHPVPLAAYADGVADVATRRGWSPDEVLGGDWTTASWPSIRLLAVCVLAAAMA